VYEYSVTHTNIRAPRVNMYVLILPINMCSFILLIINIYEVTAIRIPGSQCSGAIVDHWRHTNRIPSIHILRYATVMEMQIVVDEGMKQEIFIRKLSASRILVSPV
jgi:hypothetical protein